MGRGALAASIACAAALGLAPARAVAEPLAGQPVDCLGPAGDPAPGTQAWRQRDWANQWCAGEREFDQAANPAMNALFAEQAPRQYAEQTAAMAGDPVHPHLSIGQLLPGGTTADPFRTMSRWTAAGRGRVEPVSFTSTSGATLNGHLFRPPASLPGPYPGVVITTGSLQGYQHAYFWAAEGLAEAGYEVLTFDVQGQGSSDTFPAPDRCSSPSNCPGVPSQQAYNFFQGTEDALNFFFSGANPGRADLDPDRVGLAGHSMGAWAASVVGQCDPRVKAIVGWDNLAVAGGTCAAAASGLPAGAPARPTLSIPALGIAADYFLYPEQRDSAPDPEAKSAAYRQLSAAGTDAMQVALRSSTHLEWTYLPYLLPASRLGERVSLHYTLAWFDRYLRGSDEAFSRLVAARFDGSADASSIGTGRYDPELAAAAPADPAAGNVPHRIEGLPVRDRVSFYFASPYSLTAPDGTRATCADLRSGCGG